MAARCSEADAIVVLGSRGAATLAPRSPAVSPEPALLIDTVSRNTFENARETWRLFRARGLASVLLVSDRPMCCVLQCCFALPGCGS
jgi:uncharacterized SAM-binding protein YcdF (DUF218 family)